MTENNGSNGILEMMAEEIAQLNRRLRKVEAAQGYAEMGELAEDGEYIAELYENEYVIPKTMAESLSGISNGDSRKSPQERRDEIVERAKADVREMEERGSDTTEFNGTVGTETYREHFYVVKFEVNVKKRVVTALVRRSSIAGRPIGQPEVGIAKCAPGDCFNAHLGRAIALRRALGLDVPVEYVSVPQPTEVRVGDVVTLKDGILRGTRLKIHDQSDATLARARTDLYVIDDSREGVSAP
ncbi:hypothetical protein [Salibacterium aidingense]|uniref:hypothetical protein n=1 Tax=Salibacterium aidingense TaxID=384933 RepID=UPI003BD23CBA